MSKMKQLDLRKQEVVDECDEMRWENEGIGLSDVQVKIVEYAFMQGFHAAGDVLGHPIQENLVPDNDNECVDTVGGAYPIRWQVVAAWTSGANVSTK